MALELSHPLAIIDLETTGINLATDRIIEIAIVKVLPDKTRSVKRKLVNPQMTIPKASTDVHGITDDMVKEAPAFKDIANEIKQFIGNADLSGFNSNRFDIPLLMEEFLRVGLEFDMQGRRMVDVQHIYHFMEKRNLAAAYKYYCLKELDGAHSAEVDASATWEVLEAQVEKYPNLGTSIDSILEVVGEEPIVDFARRFILENDREVFNFGKHKGKSVADVLKREPSYYDWMMKGDFPLHTKSKLAEIMNRTILVKK